MPQAAFDLEEKELLKAVCDRKARLVLIQLPEGLKPQGPKLAHVVEKAGAIAILSADPCYGACDLAITEAERLGADLIVHYAHSEIIRQGVTPAIYFRARARASARDAIKKAIPLLKNWSSIGLVTTLQHVHQLKDAKRVLLNAGKTVVLGDRGSLKHPGQVVGCDYSNAKAISRTVDAFLFLGGGRFHAVGVALATAKPVIVADPYENRVFSVDKEAAKLIRKRWASIREAEQATEVAILIGLKIGQKRLDQALKIKRLLERRYRVVLLALREITPETLLQFPSIDAFVNTACPRISLDDSERFDKPLLTPEETMVLLGKLKWEELCKRGWFEN
jgi:2-(3-amino-3-carboxypropyl)histidine synthase